MSISNVTAVEELTVTHSIIIMKASLHDGGDQESTTMAVQLKIYEHLLCNKVSLPSSMQTTASKSPSPSWRVVVIMRCSVQDFQVADIFPASTSTFIFKSGTRQFWLRRSIPSSPSHPTGCSNASKRNHTPLSGNRDRKWIRVGT
jgi:hypothetical protein